MFINPGIILFFSLLISNAQPCDSILPDDEIVRHYKESYQVFTGFLTIKYRSASTILPDNNYIVEFEVTEIQKGPRRRKVLTYISENDSLENGNEYLIFMKKSKDKSLSGIPAAIYRVCYKCENREIKQVYSIVNHKPFKRIKPPLPEYNFSSGCDCQ